MNIITLLTLSIIIIIIIIIIVVVTVHALQRTCNFMYMIMQEILVPSTGGNKIL